MAGPPATRQTGRMHTTSRGFTAFDLLMAMAIAALLLTLGVPALRGYLAEQRLRAAARDLQSSLLHARDAAVHGRVTTVVCPGRPGADCDVQADWHGGWVLFTDGDGDRSPGPDDLLLRTAAAREGVRMTGSEARRRLRFLPDGTAPGSNVTIEVCDPGGRAATRHLRVSNSGRIRLDPAPGDAAGACGPGP